MAGLTIIPLEPTYRRDNGMMSVNLKTIRKALPFTIADQQIVQLPVFLTAGNHAHAHRECLLGLTPGLEFHWLDDHNEAHIELMHSDASLKLFIIDPWVPHAVRNTDPENSGIFYELTDSLIDPAASKAMHVIEG